MSPAAANVGFFNGLLGPLLPKDSSPHQFHIFAPPPPPCYTRHCMTAKHEVLPWALLCIALAAPTFAASPHLRSDGFYQGGLAGQVTGAPPTEVWSGGTQGGFTNNDPGEEGITNAAAHSGSNSWRFSSGYSSPGPGTPIGPPLANGVTVGPPSSGATADVFEASFWFKALNPDINSQYINVVAANTNGTDRASQAFSLVNIPGAGVTLKTLESVLTSGWDSVEIILTNGIDDSWHEVHMVGRFYDGCRNDTWTYSLDGNDLGTYGAYFEGARCNGGFTQEITSRLKIRPAFDNNANNIGFYFDDISYRAYRMADTNDIFASYFTSFEPAPPPRPPGLVFMVY